MQLTEEEKKIVLEHRQKQKEIIDQERYAVFCLETAYRYETWLQENRAGSTFSTFCDDFGFGGWDDSHSRKSTFDTVEKLRAIVYG